MEERIIIQKRPPKSSTLAGILSFFFPGTGTLYNGLVAKGVLYIIVFAGLVTIQDHGGQPFVAIMLGGFYFFQIIDAVQTANAINRKALQEAPEPAAEGMLAEAIPTGSIFWGIVLIALGIVLTLANFDVIDYDTLWDFWPVAVIGIGFKLVIDYFARSRNGK